MRGRGPARDPPADGRLFAWPRSAVIASPIAGDRDARGREGASGIGDASRGAARTARRVAGRPQPPSVVRAALPLDAWRRRAAHAGSADLPFLLDTELHRRTLALAGKADADVDRFVCHVDHRTRAALTPRPDLDLGVVIAMHADAAASVRPLPWRRCVRSDIDADTHRMLTTIATRSLTGGRAPPPSSSSPPGCSTADACAGSHTPPTAGAAVRVLAHGPVGTAQDVSSARGPGAGQDPAAASDSRNPSPARVSRPTWRSWLTAASGSSWPVSTSGWAASTLRNSTRPLDR